MFHEIRTSRGCWRGGLVGLVVLAMTVAGCEKSKSEPHYQGKPLPQWIEQLSDKDKETQGRAIEAVSKMAMEDGSGRAMKSLWAAISETDGINRVDLIVKLQILEPDHRRDKELVDALLPLTTHPDVKTRRLLADTVSAFKDGSERERVRSILQKLSADEDEAVKTTAVTELAALQSR